MTLVLALWGTTAMAQVRLGVKGGYNYTNWEFGKLDLKGDDKNGFFIGPTLKISLPAITPGVGLGVNVSGLYDQRKVKVGEADPVEIKTKMVAVPVNMQIDFLRGSSLELFIYVGPEFDFSLDKDQHILDAARTWKFKDSAFSINAGAGVLLLKCLQLSVNYNMVCGATAEVTMEGVTNDMKSFKTRANAGQLALTVYF